MAGAKEELLHLLDEKAFDPVINAPPEKYESDEDRKKLSRVKSKTESTKERYHRNYRTARDVYVNFQRDLESQGASKVHKELRELRLPTLNDVRPEVSELARKVGAK